MKSNRNERYLDQLEFFVKSPLLLLKQVLPAMKQQGYGRVIQIGSEVFEVGNPRFANYVAAKGAQLGLTRSWARELAPHGITVNLVAPGWIPTERHADATRAELDSYTQGVPMKRMGIRPKTLGKCSIPQRQPNGRLRPGKRQHLCTLQL